MIINTIMEKKTDEIPAIKVQEFLKIVIRDKAGKTHEIIKRG